MLFKNVIGQRELKQHLVEMVRQNRISHALLFLGKEGVGALSLAMAYAQYILCEETSILHSPQETEFSLFETEPISQYTPEPQSQDSCGVCPSCRKAAQLIHPDIHFSYPVITRKSGTAPISTDFIREWREFVDRYPYGNVYDWLQFIGAENKQGNITAQECNDIIHKLNLKSFESGFKILILWMPEYLGNEGNKLLKLLEEPPPDTLFILVAENESLILPTIVSRTQIIKVPPLDVKSIELALMDQVGLSSVQAHPLGSVTEGNFREALNLAQNIGEDWHLLLREWLNAIVKTGPVSQVKWIEEISRLGREKQKQFLRYFNHLLEQAIRLRIISSDNSLAKMSNGFGIAENEHDFALRLNNIADLTQQRAIIEELDNATYYIERNANAKMLFHALTIKFYNILAHRRTTQVL